MKKSRIKKFQKYLQDNNIQFFVLNRTDEFLGEYIASYAERLYWLTNFSGSTGKLLISQDSAILFVDGRYTIQAQEQINNSEITLEHLNNYWNVLSKLRKSKGTIAIDTRLHSVKEINYIKNIFKKSNLKIVFLNKNPIDLLWKNQPQYPQSKIFDHPMKFSGYDRVNKINNLKKNLKIKKLDYYFLSSLDSIAWLLNIRGRDINYTPVAFAYLLIPKKGKIVLFLSLKKINQKLKKEIKDICNVVSINNFEDFINKIKKRKSIGMDFENTSFYFKNIFQISGFKTINKTNPCILSKAVKNNIELEGARKANIRDGISLTKFLYWLKNINNYNNITEIKASEYLYNLRKDNELFFSLSFDTISAAGKNSALPHYRVTKNSNVHLENNNIYLVDSGAQYLDGTTDITRTIILGRPTKEQKDRYTRVLKGHIAIATHIFSKKTKGNDIDYLARKSLKEIGCDYDHGTGHGIGSFLSVHEGPQRIAKESNHKSVKLLPGMLISNEPGYYKQNKYGIRIENLIVVKNIKENLLEFETISFAPFDCDLIEKKLLDKSDIKWINWYQETVYNRINLFLNSKEKLWLKNVTKPL